jgi:hypothetical protein
MGCSTLVCPLSAVRPVDGFEPHAVLVTVLAALLVIQLSR